MSKHTIASLKKSVSSGRKLAWLTCYDYSFATALNQTNLDLILVGDSGGMVSLGYEDTSPVTMEEMLVLSKSVRRGAPNKFLVGDMPKGSYEASDQTAIQNAMRFVKEAGCDAVKLEGSGVMAKRVEAIVQSGIPVIGHIGLTPQSANQLGGYRVIGKSEEEFEMLKTASKELESAGVIGILLEAIPESVATVIAQNGECIYFGIGAGKNLDGQLLILHDVLGLYPNFRPKFSKNFALPALEIFMNNLKAEADLLEFGRRTRRDGILELSRIACELYVEEVQTSKFPTVEFTYS
jgi:3-methyl-2-oxobutanoate hydroxymethyltransferase